MPRYFTLEEATALISRLEELISEMRTAKRELDGLRQELSEVTRTAAGNGHLGETDLTDKREQAERLVELLNTLASDLNDLGCELKGIEEGLVDFPSLRDGREVYLCWKQGEPQIAFWHELDTGFPGRRPL